MKHSLRSDRPVRAPPKVPGGHGSGAADPAGQYPPARHANDASCDPAGQYDPAMQGAHALTSAAPYAAEYVPPGHCVGRTGPRGQ